MNDLQTHVDAPLRERCWYEPKGNGGRYWHENAEGIWVWRTREDFKLWLITEGMTKTLTKDDLAAGQIISEVDELLVELVSHRRIDFAGALAGWRAGIHEINRSRILVTRSTELVQPVPSGEGEHVWDYVGYGWPKLGAFLAGLLNGEEVDEKESESIEQLPHFVCWLWHFMDSLYQSEYSTGMALAVAGEPNSGKSLLSEILRELAGGVSAEPYRYMTGQDNFNEEFLTAGLLVVDDEASDTSIQQRLRFGAELKQICAKRGTRIRAMQTGALQLHPIQRLAIFLNLEPERLQVLPPIDNDMRDKIMVLKGYRKPMPMPARTVGERRAFWDQIRSELPAFVHWLLNVYQPPYDDLDRFGPKAYQHPAILEELGKLDPHARTHEFIERLMSRCQPRITHSHLERMSATDREKLAPLVTNGGLPGWLGTVSELRSALVADGEEACLSSIERREVRAAAYLGRDLSALARLYPRNIWMTRTPVTKQRNWIILPQPLEES